MALKAELKFTNRFLRTPDAGGGSEAPSWRRRLPTCRRTAGGPGVGRWGFWGVQKTSWPEVRATGLQSLKSCEPRFFGDGDDGGGLEAGWSVACLHGGVADSWSPQCFRAEGEGESGPAAFRGFCFLKNLLTSLSRIKRVVTEEGGGGGVGMGGPEAWAPGGLGEGGLVDGLRTVPLSFRSTVELVQLVCQAEVAHGVGGFGRFWALGGFGLVVGDLSENTVV